MARELRGVAAAIACVLAATAHECVAANDASSACRGPARLVDFGSDGRIGAKWNAATRTVAYGRPQADGHYHAYLADADGGNERRIAAPAWRDDRHQFPAAWHPRGELLAMLVEQNEHERSSVDATPGYGAYTDYWIVRRDGGAAWKLYALPDGYDHAITHAAFSPDGTKFVWTERVRAPRLWDLNLFAGAYVFKIADFVIAPQPHLENVRSVVPGGAEQGGEVESIASDNRTIAFYSTFVSKNLFASRIYTMDVESGEIRELTTESFAQAPTFTPDGRSIVYMTGSGADVFAFQLQGADWWIMNVDGSDKRRLTFMNVRGHPHSVGRFRLAGSLSFLSDTEFFGDVMTQSLGLVGKIVRVDCR
ncbi:MAG: PD40 domain-containing protein [Rhizobacter sp.]|nr:PD40 domain-containing protein [Rhizobacter sp.]